MNLPAIKPDLYQEQISEIIASFSLEQLLLFKQMIWENYESIVALEFNATAPQEYAIKVAEIRGQLKILEYLTA
jgi:hypothetical protein